MDIVLAISQLTNRIQGVIHARVFKIWQAIDTKNNNVWGMNFVLLDKEGDAIQGVMPINIYRRMEIDFVEGNICEIGRFTVEHIKNSAFRTVKHDFTLYFSGQTYVTLLAPELHDVPVCYFDFKLLEDIGTKITDEKQPFDVIGRVSNFTTIQEKLANGKPTKMQTIYMTNESGQTVEMTLWAHFVDELDIDGAYAKSNNQPIILACSSVMLKQYRGKYSLKAYAATRFYMDPGIKEIKEYLESVHCDDTAIQNSDAIVSNEGSPSNARAPNIDQIKISLGNLSMLPLDNFSTGQYLCVAQIVGVNNPFDWYYEGCPKCNGKLRQSWCVGCESKRQQPVICYKILWQVEDDTGEAEFSAIGNTAQYMIGEKASEVKDKTNLDCNELPPPLKKLIGKKYKFTVSGKLQVLYKNHRVYNILQSELIVQNELTLPAITKDDEDKTSQNKNKLSAIVEDDKLSSNDLKDNTGANKTLLKKIKQEIKTPKKKIVRPNTRRRLILGGQSIEDENIKSKNDSP
ncbi:Replication protein A 70 kDa DNA-binding subunit A [Rhynchospora pubera]|uniref:Replication protein A 70 kDa DNA-binding subunit A n=1 Tax=Rhynchospora pubera TaxID=906938 RepID=A0AAV8DBP8_9POAL|nr:Replication protein A 70 kDa DNA-binding subunit A [Rhynchospora pubera]